MMNLELIRYGFGGDSTLGRLSVDEEFACFSLEDQRQPVKVKGETCIPAGRYEIKLRTAGALHEKYKHRFPELHRGMLWLQDVPEFQWVYIHIGNTDDETEGCPLVGRVPVCLPNGEFQLLQSTPAYLDLYARILRRMSADERVWIHVSEL